MDKINPVNSKGPIINPALCRCCRSIKKCRLLNAEYEWKENREVYSEMLVDCFGLLLSHLDGEQDENCICATCVNRLRDATAFRQQVLQSEQLFLEAKLDNKDVEMKLLKEIKSEPDNSTYSDDVEDLDDIPLIDLDFKSYMSSIKTDSKINGIKHTKRHSKKAKQKTREKCDRAKRKLKDKLHSMLELPVAENSSLTPKTKDKQLDYDTMAYSNAITIVNNSYVCPFHNRISMYYCFYCRDQFTNPNELRQHTWTHDPKNFESTIENKKIPKIDISRIDCRLCTDNISDLESLKTHLTIKHSLILHPIKNEFLTFRLTIDNIDCTECGKSFQFFDLLKKHMIEHFGTHTCHACGACFLEQSSLRTHIKTHTKTESNHPCEVCGKNLKSKHSRYLHIRTVHEKKPIVNCYKCDASFLSYALRNKHLIESHGDKRTFPCNMCDKVYNRRKTLVEHNRRNHLKIYKHQCELCDQKFYLPCRLKEHMSTHVSERNFQCVSRDSRLTQTVQGGKKVHTGEKRFKCNLCSSSFMQAASLQSHARSHHRGFDLTSYG